MNNLGSRVAKFLIATLLILSVTCCLLATGYKTVTYIEWETCRDRMAKELGVSSTNVAVINAWYDKVVLLLPSGTDRKDVIATLEQFAPVTTQNLGSTLDGGFVERTSFQVCWFPANSIRLLFFYSEDNKLDVIRTDYSD